MKKLIAVCISLAGIFAAAPAAACSILAPQPHQITQEPPPDDVPPPEQPEVSVKSIERGTGPDRGLFVSSSTSCDDLGFLELKVTSSRDDVG